MADVTSKSAIQAAKKAMKSHLDTAKALQAKRGKKTALFGKETGTVTKADKDKPEAKEAPKYSKRAKPEA